MNLDKIITKRLGREDLLNQTFKSKEVNRIYQEVDKKEQENSLIDLVFLMIEDDLKTAR